MAKQVSDPHAQSKDLTRRIEEYQARIDELSEQRDPVVRDIALKRQELARALADNDKPLIAQLMKATTDLSREHDDLGAAVLTLREDCAALESQKTAVLVREYRAIYDEQGAMALQIASEFDREIEKFRDNVVAKLSPKMRTHMKEANAAFFQWERNSGGSGSSLSRLHPSPWMCMIERTCLEEFTPGKHGNGCEWGDFPEIYPVAKPNKA